MRLRRAILSAGALLALSATVAMAIVADRSALARAITDLLPRPAGFTPVPGSNLSETHASPLHRVTGDSVPEGYCPLPPKGAQTSVATAAPDPAEDLPLYGQSVIPDSAALCTGTPEAAAPLPGGLVP